MTTMPKICINGTIRNMSPEEIKEFEEFERTAEQTPTQSVPAMGQRIEELASALSLLLEGTTE